MASAYSGGWMFIYAGLDYASGNMSNVNFIYRNINMGNKVYILVIENILSIKNKF